MKRVGRPLGAGPVQGLAFAACWAVLAVFSGSCSRKSEPKPAPEAASAVAQATEAKVGPSDPVEAAISRIVEHCSFNEEHAVISKCDNNEKQTAIRDFNTGKLSRTDAFPTLVEALESTDRKRSVVASKLLESAFRNSFGTSKTEQVNKGSATKLLGLLRTLPERQVTQVAPAAVHAAMLTGQQAALYEALDEHPNKDLRASAYVYLLRYGTLKELPKIQSLVQGPDERVAASAIEALRRMPSQTPEESKQVCEFVKPLAQDPRGPVAGKAMAQLVTCGGEYLDAALTAAQKQQKDGALPAAVVRGFDQTCVAHRGESRGNAAQCARLRTFLEQLIADAKQTVDARQFALLGLGLQFPDEATVKVAEKYLTAEDKRIKSAAERVARSVGAKLKAGPAGPQPANAKPGPPGTRTPRVSPPVSSGKPATATKPVPQARPQ